MSDQEKMREERCPDCGRVKARDAMEAAHGHCEKWYAVRDPEAREECDAIKAFHAAHYERQLSAAQESAKTWHGRYTSACQQHAGRLARAGGEIIALEENLAAAQADNVRLREALRNIAHGDARAIGKAEKCGHGQHGYENCEACYADYAERALSQPLDTSALDSLLAEERNVPDGWKFDKRQLSVVRFALSRFANDARHKANEAAQDKASLLYQDPSAAMKSFLRDAEDAEGLYSMLAAPQPEETEGKKI